MSPYGNNKRAIEWYLDILHRATEAKFMSFRSVNAAVASDERGEDPNPAITPAFPLRLDSSNRSLDFYSVSA